MPKPFNKKLYTAINSEELFAITESTVKVFEVFISVTLDEKSLNLTNPLVLPVIGNILGSMVCFHVIT